MRPATAPMFVLTALRGSLWHAVPSETTGDRRPKPVATKHLKISLYRLLAYPYRIGAYASTRYSGTLSRLEMRCLALLPALGAAMHRFGPAIDRLRASEQPGTLLQCNMGEPHLMRRHQIRQCAHTVRFRRLPLPPTCLQRQHRRLSHAALFLQIRPTATPTLLCQVLSFSLTIPFKPLFDC